MELIRRGLLGEIIFLGLLYFYISLVSGRGQIELKIQVYRYIKEYQISLGAKTMMYLHSQ